MPTQSQHPDHIAQRHQRRARPPGGRRPPARRLDQADSRARWFRQLFVEVAAEALQTSGCKAGIKLAA